MSFHQLITEMTDSIGVSLLTFAPELAICATIVALLLVRMIASKWTEGAFYVMLVGSAAACFLALPWQLLAKDIQIPQETFTGLLVFDTFTIYMRCLLLFFLLLFTTFTQISGVPGREEATEFYVLLLGATLGMCLMVSANHLMVVFLAVEMASVPSYVLAGMARHRRVSSEASLKYAVFGAGTAGVMLYGISLLAGTLGTAHLPTMAVRLAEQLDSSHHSAVASEHGDTEETADPHAEKEVAEHPEEGSHGGAHGDAHASASPGDQRKLVLVLGGLMVMVGLAFKLSAVPFHFWAPDVFEGATAEVAAFLSIASKAAALALLVRLALGLGHTAGPLLAALEPARVYISGLIGLLAAVTCTFGNLAAYGQTNIKRLLAYSTIAHAGYMMMAVAAAVAMAGHDSAGANDAVTGLACYLAVYLFMNLAAFAVVAFVRNTAGSEEIADYAGMIHRSPGLTICLSLVMFSLLGLPPLAGFTAKFAVFAPLANAGSGMLVLLAIGVLNAVLSLFYYLRVVRVMIFESEAEDRPAPTIPIASLPGMFCVILTAPLILLFVFWEGLNWAAFDLLR